LVTDTLPAPSSSIVTEPESGTVHGVHSWLAIDMRDEPPTV
jgi:hypothetical protein